MKLVPIFSLMVLTVSAMPNGQAPEGQTWVVLCSGGIGWKNYAITANVYHAYQTIKMQGIPDKNIIIMHYDDLANSPENPTPGVIVNELNGTNVYKGVPKDYVGDDVTPHNFLGVISGDPALEAKGKRVVKSGPKDNIFVFFMDHGVQGAVLFPKAYLFADDLNNMLKKMNMEQKFAKLVFYLEACISAGWFTMNWMFDMEHIDPQVELLDRQYKYIAEHNNITLFNATFFQHAQHYGDLKIAQQHISDFLGTKKVPTTGANSVVVHKNAEFVNFRDIPIKLTEKNIQSTNDINEKQLYVDELSQLLKGRQYVDQHLRAFVDSVHHMTRLDTNALLNSKLELSEDMTCYKKFVDIFHDKCFNMNKNTYAFSKIYVFNNICNQMINDNHVNVAVAFLEQYCTQNGVSGYMSNIE
ncbi:unnamed protein product [Oppiella nova]|uniref:Legumain prodomain domain-containing protein n=1 Tax=Oppiella nova TaxID=334625 RepID=A0A7R9LIP6_9ACAR|nr:unnamed protein product [Oppiella nova]CAG2163981.1 unnamed protein product [Oppiella nova]